MHQVGDGGAQDAGGVYSKVRIEAAVLDGDERLRQIGRQILQRDIGAGHFAAGGDNTAVHAGDLDGGRALGNFQRLNRRQMRTDPDNDTGGGNDRPQAQNCAPVNQAAKARSRPASRF
jgi:hypothetical protein